MGAVATNADELNPSGAPADIEAYKREEKVRLQYYAARRAALKTVIETHRLRGMNAHETHCSCGWSGPEANITAHLEEATRDLSQSQHRSAQAEDGTKRA